MPPFLYLEGRGSEARVSGGLEGRLLQTLAQRLNLSFMLHAPSEGQEPTSSRAMKMVSRSHFEAKLFSVGKLLCFNGDKSLYYCSHLTSVPTQLMCSYSFAKFTREFSFAKSSFTESSHFKSVPMGLMCASWTIES